MSSGHLSVPITREPHGSLASCYDAKQYTCGEDDPISMGTSTPSEVASLGGATTPGSEEHRRWCDIVDDDVWHDDIGDGSDTKGGRRRSRRSNRSKKASGACNDDASDAHEFGRHYCDVQHTSLPENRDHAFVALDNLGLLLGTPASANVPRAAAPQAMGDSYTEQSMPLSPSRALMGTRCIVGTSPVHCVPPPTVHTAEASSRHSVEYVGFGFPSYDASFAYATHHGPAMGGCASQQGSHVPAYLPSCNMLGNPHVPPEHNAPFSIADPHHHLFLAAEALKQLDTQVGLQARAPEVYED